MTVKVSVLGAVFPARAFVAIYLWLEMVSVNITAFSSQFSIAIRSFPGNYFLCSRVGSAKASRCFDIESVGVGRARSLALSGARSHAGLNLCIVHKLRCRAHERRNPLDFEELTRGLTDACTSYH